ncbi:MAG: DUF349 domain-containing protein, partial [Cytophagales bacterium]|nr:DUF349 domain-containing protein [Cytophagales bacterium]
KVFSWKERWEKLGPVPRRDDTQGLAKRFWQMFKTFLQEKDKFFKELKKEKGTLLEERKKLIQEVYALKNTEDWEKATQQILDIQKLWKGAKRLAKSPADKLNIQFKEALQAFEEGRTEYNQSFLKEHQTHIKKILDLLKELLGLHEKQSFQEGWDKFLKEFQILPSSVQQTLKEEIYQELEKKWDQESKISMEQGLSFLWARWLIKCIRDLGDPNPPFLQKKKIENQKKIRQLKEELFLHQRNLSFFKNNPPEDPLRKEMQTKVDLTEKKIKAIESAIPSV